MDHGHSVKTVHIYIALAIMVATVLSTFVGIGERIGQVTTKFDGLAGNVGDIRTEIKAMSLTMRENEDRLIRQEERLRQFLGDPERVDRWQRSARSGRQFDK